MAEFAEALEQMSKLLDKHPGWALMFTLMALAYLGVQVTTAVNVAYMKKHMVSAKTCEIHKLEIENKLAVIPQLQQQVGALASIKHKGNGSLEYGNYPGGD